MNSESIENFYYNNKKPIKILGFFVLFVFVLLFVVIIGVLLFGPRVDKARIVIDTRSLPGDLEKNLDPVNDSELNGIKAEDIMFGHFYKESKDNFVPSLSSYDLPINVKSEAENYFDISRKIDLSDHIEELNENGFKIIKNPFSNKNDFFSIYNQLLDKEIPVVITKDFLMYYYQNNLKNIFDEIERNTFYKNVWDIYRDLFSVASARYEKRLARLGISKDPVLEAERLETAYLAIVLKLLTPNKSQVVEHKSLNDNSKFSKAESIYFDFALPDYLKSDVERELRYIREMRQLEMSPVFLYPRDYKTFNVPSGYSADAKLHNFYLATKWLNSEFPLYFRSDDCPKCLLDKNDWLINMASASLLSKDMNDSQVNKNKWAIIYKFLSYFSGLRQDLTYLEYDEAMREIYGKGYVIENIFSNKNFSDVDIYKIQAKIAENDFSEIEGSYSREEDGDKPKIGMRILQEPFWPNSYILDRLAEQSMKSTLSTKDRKEQLTLCDNYRCSGSALDIFNLANPLEMNAEFVRESSYSVYDVEVRKLREYMNGFNDFTWNTNIYWSTLDTLNISLAEDRSRYPVFMIGDDWFNKKELNTSLGFWFNIHLPKDNFSISSSGAVDFAMDRPVCDLPNYIEPGNSYLFENISRNNMLLEMMDVLNVSRDTNLAALDINDVNSMFELVI